MRGDDQIPGAIHPTISCNNSIFPHYPPPLPPQSLLLVVIVTGPGLTLVPTRAARPLRGGVADPEFRLKLTDVNCRSNDPCCN